MNHLGKKVLILIITVLLFSCNYSNDNKLYWTAINVNDKAQQGDANLIVKNGKAILIDAGHISYSKDYLLPFLRKKGIKKLDAIYITHPHNDHYGGVIEVLKSDIKVKTIYMNFPTKEQMDREWWGGSYADLIEIKNLANSHNIEIRPIKIGDKFIFDKNTYLEVLYVYDGIHTPVGKTDINDMSAIMMLYDNGRRFLFTGDLNMKLGKYLADNASNIKADVLKVPHHGTEGLAPDSFFEKVNPKILIIPSPKNLWCSKRSSRIRNLAKKNGYKVYINGFHGNITVISDNGKIIVKTERSPTYICKEK